MRDGAHVQHERVAESSAVQDKWSTFFDVGRQRDAGERERDREKERERGRNRAGERERKSRNDTLQSASQSVSFDPSVTTCRKMISLKESPPPSQRAENNSIK